MPHLQAIYDKLKAKGLRVVTINEGAGKAEIRKGFREKGLSLPTGMNGKGANNVHQPYRVPGPYTHYVIDASGKIAARFINYDEPGIRKALKGLGLEP